MRNSIPTNIDIISVLRLPLIVGVVFIHSLSMTHGVYLVYDFFYDALTEIICETCVPLFFFFSGYLFFQNVKSFDFDVFKQKLSRRVKSLLIPYLFWNIFVVVIIGAGQMLAPSLFTGAFKRVVDFTVNDWLSIFYCALGSTQPIAYQLWFLRNLMVMILLTPLIYYLCKYLNYWWLIVLVVLPKFGIDGMFPGLNLFSLSFFAAGCWFGIYKCSFIIKPINIRFIIAIAFLLFYGTEIFLHLRGITHGGFHKISVMMGCFAIIQFVSLIIQNKDSSRFFYMKPMINNSTFFIYCYHGIFASFLAGTLSKYVTCDAFAVLAYIMIVLALVLFGVFAYNLLLKTLPGFTRVITGGR